jgi:predicted TIM-barrel enzyme
MPSRSDRFKSAVVKAAQRAKQAALVAMREAERLLKDAKTRAATEVRQRQLKLKLKRMATVLKAAGKAAVVAGVAAGTAAAQRELKRQKPLKRLRS